MVARQVLIAEALATFVADEGLSLAGLELGNLGPRFRLCLFVILVFAFGEFRRPDGIQGFVLVVFEPLESPLNYNREYRRQLADRRRRGGLSGLNRRPPDCLMAILARASSKPISSNCCRSEGIVAAQT